MLKPNQCISLCANCGAESGTAVIAGDDGEWFCSEFCYDEHNKLGCPHQILGGIYRNGPSGPNNSNSEHLGDSKAP